jgi:riboflavin synthase
MFTGLVEAVGELVERTATGGGCRLTISSPLARELAPGDSVAVNGVCLTVIRAERDEMSAEVGPETVRVTTLGSLREGAPVNLERPLRADSRLGGHFVQGTWTPSDRSKSRAEAEFHWLTVAFPRRLAPYMVHKGSIAVDGISLTIAGLDDDRFDLQIVPFTMQHTNLGRAAVRDGVNLECDMVGKYVARAAELAGLHVSVRPGEVTH